MDIRKAWEGAFQTLNGGKEGIDGIIHVTKAWKTLTTTLNPENITLSRTEVSQKIILSNISILRNARLEGRIIEWYLDSVLSYMSQRYRDKITTWTTDFKLREKNSLEHELAQWVLGTFTEVINNLHDNFITCKWPLTILDASQSTFAKYDRQYQAQLHRLLPRSFYRIIGIFYRTIFRIFEHLHLRERREQVTPSSFFLLAAPLMDAGVKRRMMGNDNIVMDLFAFNEGLQLEHTDSAVDQTMESDEEEDYSIFEDELRDSDEIGQKFLSTLTIQDLVQYISDFSSHCAKLEEIGIIYHTESIYTNMLNTEIEDHLYRLCAKKFDEPMIKRGLKWVRTVILGWLRLVICHGEDVGELSQNRLSALLQWKTRLEYHLFNTFCDLRISELFDIIIDFPESMPALHDLKECMDKTDPKQQLLESLRSALQRRLLLPAVDTMQILDSYISCIKCFRILDPTNVMLEYVVQPIRNYLRGREDTIRCIVMSLVDEDGHGDLLEDLSGEPVPVSDDEIEDFNDSNWMPDPIDAGPNYRATSKRATDIISMLVNIYDSKDVFVKEFQLLLADRLLAVKDYDTEREVRNLELLKLRFGDSSFQLCEVMIKDIADSKRIDSHVHSDPVYLEADDFSLHTMVLSRLFWPPFRTEKLDVPEHVERLFNTYEKSFEKLKANRKLIWLRHLGTVKVELELEDRTLEFDVSPALASIIHCFQEQSSWSLEDLSANMKLEPGQLKRRLGYWVNQGVLSHGPNDVYTVLEVAASSPSASATLAPEDATDSAIQSVAEQQAEEMRIYWQFITGMLTNFSSQPLEKIHKMLQMFLPGEYNRSANELKEFLAVMTREGKLEYIGGTYKLRKV